jgi:uncharacterized protein YozE (UPF0346 family)
MDVTKKAANLRQIRGSFSDSCSFAKFAADFILISDYLLKSAAIGFG